MYIQLYISHYYIYNKIKVVSLAELPISSFHKMKSEKDEKIQNFVQILKRLHKHEQICSKQNKIIKEKSYKCNPKQNVNSPALNSLRLQALRIEKQSQRISNNVSQTSNLANHRLYGKTMSQRQKQSPLYQQLRSKNSPTYNQSQKSQPEVGVSFRHNKFGAFYRQNGTKIDNSRHIENDNWLDFQNRRIKSQIMEQSHSPKAKQFKSMINSTTFATSMNPQERQKIMPVSPSPNKNKSILYFVTPPKKFSNQHKKDANKPPEGVPANFTIGSIVLANQSQIPTLRVGSGKNKTKVTKYSQYCEGIYQKFRNSQVQSNENEGKSIKVSFNVNQNKYMNRAGKLNKMKIKMLNHRQSGDEQFPTGRKDKSRKLISIWKNMQNQFKKFRNIDLYARSPNNSNSQQSIEFKKYIQSQEIAPSTEAEIDNSINLKPMGLEKASQQKSNEKNKILQNSNTPGKTNSQKQKQQKKQIKQGKNDLKRRQILEFGSKEEKIPLNETKEYLESDIKIEAWQQHTKHNTKYGTVKIVVDSRTNSMSSAILI